MSSSSPPVGPGRTPRNERTPDRVGAPLRARRRRRGARAAGPRQRRAQPRGGSRAAGPRGARPGPREGRPARRGAVVAAVQAGLGASIDEVAAAAARPAACPSTGGRRDTERRMKVIDPAGLHPRRAARIVQLASLTAASRSATVTRGGRPEPPRILGLAVGASSEVASPRGERCRRSARGPQGRARPSPPAEAAAEPGAGAIGSRWMTRPGGFDDQARG